jgi:lipoate-protein ligase A
MIDTWRLIISPALGGQRNMAIDEAILLTTIKHDSYPTLRLYAWDPGCLSLGYAQPFSDVDEQALVGKGWEFVRRPTGGRAILHIDELTYSVSATADTPVMQGGVLESYRRLSAGLVIALGLLGIGANADKEYDSSELHRDHPVCFEIPSNYEITANGKKLIGSAQSRKMGGVLQHGTLPLFGDIARISDVLKCSLEQDRLQARNRIYTHATTLEESLGRKVSWEEAARAVIAGFTKALSISLVESPLTDEENELADHLLRTKYSTREWNCK